MINYTLRKARRAVARSYRENAVTGSYAKRKPSPRKLENHEVIAKLKARPKAEGRREGL